MPYLESSTMSPLDYQSMLIWASQITGQDMNKIETAINQVAAQYPVSRSEYLAEVLRSNGMVVEKAADGTWRGAFQGQYANVNNAAATAVNSNATSIFSGNLRMKYNMTPQFDSATGYTFMQASRFPISGGFANQALYMVGSVASAVGAVSAGITLGKKIDSTLYNLNPDFWDSVGMSSLNPETWNSITNGDDSNFAGLFNLIMGLDPATGNSQAYMDENALAYFAYYMKENGVFTENIDITIDSSKLPSGFPITIVNNSPNVITPMFIGRYNNESSDTLHYARQLTGSSPMYCIAIITYDSDVSSIYSRITWLFFSESAFTFESTLNTSYIATASSSSSTYKGKTVYYYTTITYNSNFRDSTVMPAAQVNSSGYEYSSLFTPSGYTSSYLWALLYSSTIISGGIDGISNQPNATIPNVSDWNDIPSTLSSLKQQYPDLWDDAIVWDNVQPDGSNPQMTYVPVGMPQATSATDTQPTTGNQTQTDTLVNTNTDLLAQLLTQILTQTSTESDPSIPPANPVDTGSGDSPTPVAPTGSASALWSVYHPTQAQINSFGAWLWGSPFLTNIGKLFQNPIDGVISLHKIFATPVDSGTGNIVVGTLDSNVSSATVNQQYVTVDCGYVDCQEEFGNVFDYPPFTKVSLYLPFIGIVNLDTDDVMRSTIHVTYGVDIFTGACLAMVEVKRDLNVVNLYQYAGVCAVTYPLGNVQHAQLVSGLLAVAGGVAASVASGGVGAPAALAMAGGLASASSSSIGRSGGFSGNAGAMGIKKPYLILQRPQTKVADTFPALAGYPTNISGKLSDFSGQVNVKSVHVEGINATDVELKEIEALLKSGVLV